MQYLDYIIDHYTWAGAALILLLLVLFFIQISYYAGTYRRVVKYRDSKRKKRLKEVPPISVIIPLMSEDYSFLRERLPHILTQTYQSSYEVVVMFIGNNNDYREELEAMRLQYPTLRTAYLQYNPLLTISPKQAINLGIKSALNEHMVITTPDTVPATDNWLAMMGKGFMRGEIVGGYTAIEHTEGLSNYIIRMSRMQMAIYHFAGAVKGEAYNLSRSNFGLTKSVYFAANGFSHRNMNIGENDLFIQKIATRKNVSIVMTPKATVEERQWGGLNWWLTRLRYFGVAYNLYPSKARNRIEWDLRSQTLFLITAVATIILMPLEVKLFAALLLLLRLVAVLTTVGSIAKRLGEKGVVARYTLFDMVNPVLMTWLRIKTLHKDHSAWK